MKYFTKQFVRNSFFVDYHLGFKVDRRAETKDSVFFDELSRQWQEQYHVSDDSEFTAFLNEKVMDDEHILPETVKAQIADARVFALKVCSQNVYNSLQKLSIETAEMMERIEQSYRSDPKNADPIITLDKIGCYDHEVKKTYWCGRTFYIEYKTDPRYVGKEKFAFKHCIVELCEKSIVGNHLAYHEVYKDADGFRVEFLFCGQNGDIYLNLVMKKH